MSTLLKHDGFVVSLKQLRFDLICSESASKDLSLSSRCPAPMEHMMRGCPEDLYRKQSVVAAIPLLPSTLLPAATTFFWSQPHDNGFHLRQLQSGKHFDVERHDADEHNSHPLPPPRDHILIVGVFLGDNTSSSLKRDNIE